MKKPFNQTIPLPEFNPILQDSYEILFFDRDISPVLISPWDVRNYVLSFDDAGAELLIDITGLLETYSLDQFRSVKYIKLIYKNSDGSINSEHTFDVTKMSGRTSGAYASGQWMTYQINFDVK
jgi:hypothetical protein